MICEYSTWVHSFEQCGCDRIKTYVYLSAKESAVSHGPEGGGSDLVILGVSDLAVDDGLQHFGEATPSQVVHEGEGGELVFSGGHLVVPTGYSNRRLKWIRIITFSHRIIGIFSYVCTDLCIAFLAYPPASSWTHCICSGLKACPARSQVMRTKCPMTKGTAM